MEKCKFVSLLGLQLQLLGSRARGQSLHRLSYRGSLTSVTEAMSLKNRAEKNADESGRDLTYRYIRKFGQRD
jgi:hypothetical protein